MLRFNLNFFEISTRTTFDYIWIYFNVGTQREFAFNFREYINVYEHLQYLFFWFNKNVWR